jgi:DNA modification methylase
VAAQLRRDYILIDLKEEYCDMVKERVSEGETGIPIAEARRGQKGLFEEFVKDG